MCGKWKMGIRSQQWKGSENSRARQTVYTLSMAVTTKKQRQRQRQRYQQRKKPSCKISNYAVTLVHIWYNIWVNLRHIAGFNFDSSALAFSNHLCGCRFFLPFPFFVCTTEHIKLNMMNENISAHILKFYIKNTNTCK